MFIRSTHSLSFMLFSRPTSILARSCNVPRVKAATTRLGIHVHKNPQTCSFTPTPRDYKATKSKPKSPPSPEPSTKKNPLPSPTDPKAQSKQVQTPTDSDMEEYIPGFSKLGVNAKLVAIRSLKSYLSSEIQKKDTEWKLGAYEALMGRLDMKEKEIWEADTWYMKALRGIAWGPTIVINFIIEVLLS